MVVVGGMSMVFAPLLNIGSIEVPLRIVPCHGDELGGLNTQQISATAASSTSHPFITSRVNNGPA